MYVNSLMFNPPLKSNVCFGCRDVSIFSAPAKDRQAHMEKSGFAEDIFEKGGNSLYVQISRPPIRPNLEKDLEDYFDPNVEPDYKGHKLEGCGIILSDQNGQFDIQKTIGAPWKTPGFDMKRTIKTYGDKDGRILGMHVRFSDVDEPVDPKTTKHRLHPHPLPELNAHLTHHGTTADALGWLTEQGLKLEGLKGTDSALLSLYLAKELKQNAKGKTLKDLSTKESVSIIQNAFTKMLNGSYVPERKRGTFNVKIFDGIRQFVIAFNEPVHKPGQPLRPPKLPMMAIHTRKDGGQELVVSLEPIRPAPQYNASLTAWETIPHNQIAVFDISEEGKILQTRHILVQDLKK